MKMNEQKEVGLVKNFLNKCKYSIQGLKYCFKNESSFVIISLSACLIIILGMYFDITFMEWVLTFGSLIILMIIELINTAIEATVDMVTLEYNEYAKIAKDCGSAAEGLMGVLSGIVNLIIFIPYLIKFFINI
jgi:undecaprenol kinase